MKRCYFVYFLCLTIGSYLLVLKPINTCGQESYDDSNSMFREIDDLLRGESFDLAGQRLMSIVQGLEVDKDAAAYLEVLNRLTNIYLHKSNFTKADSCLQVAFSFAEEKDLLTKAAFAKTIGIRGEYHDRKGMYPQAKADIKEALDLENKAESPDSIFIAEQLNHLGRVEGLDGNLEAADRYCKQALDIVLRLQGEKHILAASAYSNLGVNMKDRGDYAQAKIYYLESLRIRLDLLGKRHTQVGDSYVNLGTAHYYMGEYNEAEPYYRKALRVFEQKLGPTAIKVAYANMNIGIIHAMRNENLLALRYFDREREIKEAVYGSTHPDLVYSYNNVSFIYQRLNDLDKSLEMHEKALEVCKQVYGDRHFYLAQTYDNIAYVYQLQGKYQEALDYVQEGLIAGTYRFEEVDVNKNPDPDDYLNPAELLRMYRRKAELFESLAAEVEDQTPLLNKALAQINASKALLDHMRNSYRSEESKLLWQRGVKAQFEKGVNLAYRLYQLTGDETYLANAFELFEKSKSALLLASLQNDEALVFAGIPADLLGFEERLQKDLSYYAQQTNTTVDSSEKVAFQQQHFLLKNRYDSLMLALEQQYPDYYRLKYSSDVISLVELQRNVQASDKLWIEYFVGDTSMFALRVYEDQADLLQLAKPIDLSKRITELRQDIYGYFLQDVKTDSLFRRNKAKYISHAHSLFKDLMKASVSDLPKQYTSTVIVPDGPLGYLPFEILLQEEHGEEEDFFDLSYLLSSTSISYAYSASLLKEMQEDDRTIKPSESALVLAPSFPEEQVNYASIEDRRRDGFGPLAFNEKEAEGISSILGGKILAGTQASIENLLKYASNYQILHFATHGKVNEANAALSFLALAPQSDTAQYEPLYMEDLYNLKLGAEMVVLSACETGLGELKKGEGIASLSRAFSYAGAQSIITTLWSVNDKQTSEIMTNFYQNLDEGMPKDEALRQAKLTYLSQSDAYYAHPFFWAAPIPVGNMTPLSRQTGWRLYILGILALLALTGFVYWRNNR